MNLSIQTQVTRAAYNSAVGEDASFNSLAHGAIPSLRVVRDTSNATQLAASLLGLRGIVLSFRVLVEDITNRPTKGDTLTTADGTHNVDQAENISETEWRIYVRS